MTVIPHCYPLSCKVCTFTDQTSTELNPTTHSEKSHANTAIAST